MELLKDEPVNLIPKPLAELLAQINDKEEECLKTIHARFCIPRAIQISVGDISRYYPDKVNDPNYYEYWYKWQTPHQFFLMSRRLNISLDRGPILDIQYNKKLKRDGE